MIFSVICTFAKIHVYGLFSDNMVIQRYEPIVVTGSCLPNESITVCLHNSKVNIKANKYGHWQVKLPCEKAGGPYLLEIKAKDETVSFHNILIGDVWFAAGQSNMEHPMEGWEWLPHSSVYQFEEEIKDIDFPCVRLLTIPKNVSSLATKDIVADWKMVNSINIRSFSSIGWFFAKRLNQKLNIPIGIINCSWAGTSIKSWESKDVLSLFKDSIKYDENDYIPSKKVVTENLINNRERNCLIANSGKNDFDMIFSSPDSCWHPINLCQIQSLDQEIVWIKKEFDIPEAYANKNFYMSLGYLTKYFVIYLNGKFLSSGMYPELIETFIPRYNIYPGRNTLIMRLGSRSGTPKFLGGKEFGLHTVDNDYHMELSSNWYVNRKKTVLPAAKKEYQGYPCSIFNGMVAPCLNFRIKGIIWYQGENDIDIPDLYSRLFKGLIQDWRKKWGEKDLPFLFVQLSLVPFDHLNSNETKCQYFRKCQNIDVPNTYMVSSLDIGDPYNVHPRNKRVIGERLVDGAIKIVYTNK